MPTKNNRRQGTLATALVTAAFVAVVCLRHGAAGIAAADEAPSPSDKLSESKPADAKPSDSKPAETIPPAAKPEERSAEVDADVNLFADAIAFAQARCVKLYGAGIGREHGYATGIIVSPDGLILTAQGIYLAGDRIRVVLPDGSVHLAEVRRRSEPLQTALLKIDAATPKYFDVPEVQPARKGEWVLAVSNLFKVAEGDEELSVNLGVASLRTKLEAKRGTSDVPYDEELMLIDAITSNPGAPGGAVVTIDGRLAGMVGKIIESTSTNTRLNYAVPSDLLRQFIDDKPVRVVSLTPLPAAGKASLGFQLFTLGGKRAPAYIESVQRGSPADKAGVRKDDLVLTLGGEIVRNVADAQKAMAELRPGQEVPILLKRKQEILQVSITAEQDKSDVKKPK